MSRRRAQRQATFKRRNPARTTQRAIPTILPILSRSRISRKANNNPHPFEFTLRPCLVIWTNISWYFLPDWS